MSHFWIGVVDTHQWLGSPPLETEPLYITSSIPWARDHSGQ